MKEEEFRKLIRLEWETISEGRDEYFKELKKLMNIKSKKKK